MDSNITKTHHIVRIPKKVYVKLAASAKKRDSTVTALMVQIFYEWLTAHKENIEPKAPEREFVNPNPDPDPYDIEIDIAYAEILEARAAAKRSYLTPEENIPAPLLTDEEMKAKLDATFSVVDLDKRK